MRRFQQYRATLIDGVVQSKDPIGKPKAIVDSAAEYLEIEAEVTIKKSTSKKTVMLWLDVSEAEAEKAAEIEAQKIADKAKQDADDAKAKELKDREEAVKAKEIAQAPVVKRSARKK